MTREGRKVLEHLQCDYNMIYLQVENKNCSNCVWFYEKDLRLDHNKMMCLRRGTGTDEGRETMTPYKPCDLFMNGPSVSFWKHNKDLDQQCCLFIHTKSPKVVTQKLILFFLSWGCSLSCTYIYFLSILLPSKTCH